MMRACWTRPWPCRFRASGAWIFFPSIEEKAARLGYGLVQNHPMTDGNKRLGAHAMLVFLTLNGIELDYTQQELIDVIMGLAAGVHDCAHLTRWIREHRREAGGTRVQDNQDL